MGPCSLGTESEESWVLQGLAQLPNETCQVAGLASVASKELHNERVGLLPV